MTGGIAVVIFLSTFSVIQSLEIPIEKKLTEAALGDTVNLTCEDHGHEKGLFYWYKMNYSYKFQTVAMGNFGKVKLRGEFSNSRFKVSIKGNVYSLTIRNVNKEDEATYLCQTGAAYEMAFVNITHLTVGSQIKSYVNQSSDSKSVTLGNTMTLQCSLLSQRRQNSNQCGHERNIFWFRAGSKSHLGLISTERINCDEGRSCVYSLSTTIQNSWDSGTYYCAVVTCGEILFGEGTEVEIKQELCPLIIVLGVLLGCSVLVNFILIVTKKRQKRVSDSSIGKLTPSSHAKLDGSAEDCPTILDDEEDGINYVALNFPSRKPTKWKNRRETSEECTYSNIKLSVKGSVRE